MRKSSHSSFALRVSFVIRHSNFVIPRVIFSCCAETERLHCRGKGGGRRLSSNQRGRSGRVLAPRAPGSERSLQTTSDPGGHDATSLPPGSSCQSDLREPRRVQKFAMRSLPQTIPPLRTPRTASLRRTSPSKGRYPYSTRISALRHRSNCAATFCGDGAPIACRAAIDFSTRRTS